jgi:cytochrome c556
MKSRMMVAIASLITVVLVSQTGHGQKPDLRDFMRAKLKLSQSILEGLVREELDPVARAANDLKLLSLDSSWQVLQTPEYLEYSRRFRDDADTLREAAKKHKLDAATVAFNQVTTRCVECHKYVRGVRMAKAN